VELWIEDLMVSQFVDVAPDRTWDNAAKLCTVRIINRCCQVAIPQIRFKIDI